MRKALPLSALLSGLLATPLMATPPQHVQVAAGDSSSIVTAPFADSPSEVAAAQLPQQFYPQLQILINGEPLNTYGMQELNHRIAADMQWRLNGLLLQQRNNLPTTVEVQYAAPRVGQQRLEKGAYLGITSSPVSGVVRNQLSIPRGMGLVVDFVEQGSPAEAAGLRVHDILQKLEDQWLVNPQQLAVLVRSKRPGESIAMTVLRGGKETVVSATLAEKDLPVLETITEGGLVPNWGGGGGGGGAVTIAPGRAIGDVQIQPRAASTSLRIEADGTERRTLLDDQHDITILKSKDGAERITVKDRSGRTFYEGAGNDLPADTAGKVHELRRKNAGLTFEGNAAGENAKSVTLTRADTDHQITLRADERGRSLAVKDLRSGRMLFEGPFRGDEDLRTLPAPVADKVKALTAKAPLPGEKPANPPETQTPGL